MRVVTIHDLWLDRHPILEKDVGQCRPRSRRDRPRFEQKSHHDIGISAKNHELYG